MRNLVNIVPFCLSIEAVRIIFGAFDGSGHELLIVRLEELQILRFEDLSTVGEAAT